MQSRFAGGILAVACAALVAAVQADTVQLSNGDNVSGKVIGLDDKHVKLQSEVFGQLSIERSKVAAIYFGDGPPKNAPVAQVQVQVPVPVKPTQPGQEVLDQLRSSGLDPATLNDVKKAFPLLAQPGAGKYFDDSLSGLMSGKVGVQDIRKDAMKVIDEVNKLEKELGPQATQALRPYMSILENFVRETEPKNPPPANQPKK